MAKKNYDIDALFDESAPKPVVEEQPAPIKEQKAQPPMEPVSAAPAAAQQVSRTQEKRESKKTSKQVFADSPKSKHTFEIPNDVWTDFEILLFVLQQQGNKKTQNGYITELLQGEIEDNKDLIERFKKMTGVK